MLRQMRLLMVPRFPHRRAIEGEAPLVVMVHGFMAGGRVFDPFRKQVERDLGLDTAVFGYGSLADFDRTIDRLGAFIDRVVPTERPFVVLGHSLGGVLARTYLERDDARRPNRLITVSTPHLGTERAAIAPGKLGAAIRPGSDVLARLASARSTVPVHVIAGALDRTVPPPSALAGGAYVVSRDLVPGVGHNAILYRQDAVSVLLDALLDATGPGLMRSPAE